MGIKIRKHGSVIASFATPQEIVIDHANDDIRVGDGTDLMGPLTNVGGTLCFPVAIKEIAAGTLATNAAQTDGTQKTQVVDESGNSLDSTLLGGSYALKVDVVSTVGGGAAPAHTDDAAFTVGSDQVTVIGALFDDTATDSVDEGDAGGLRMTADRLLKIQLASVLSGVAVPITDNAGSLTIDNANIDAALSTLATHAKQDTIIGHLDGVEGLLTTIDGDTGAMNTNLAAIAATVAASGTELDVAVISSALPSGAATAARQDTGNTSLATLAGAVSGTEMQVDVLTMPTVTVQDGGGSLTVDGSVSIGNSPTVFCVGNAAHDAAVSGNPVRIAGRARSALNITSVAADDTVDMACDNQGRVITTPHAPRDLIVQATGSQATTTEATMLAAGGAGVFYDLTKLILTNSSSTATRVQIRDATAGTIRLEVALAANGGAVIDFGNVPMTQTTAANNWTIDLSAAVTSVYYFVQAVARIA